MSRFDMHMAFRSGENVCDSLIQLCDDMDKDHRKNNMYFRAR